MVYFIDRYFEEEEHETLILKSKEWTIEQMADIVGILSLLYKECKQGYDNCPMDKLKKVLIEEYGCKDVSHKYNYERELPFIKRRIVSKTLFIGFELSGCTVTWLDVNEAEELCEKKSIYTLLKKYVKEDQRLAIQKIFKETDMKLAQLRRENFMSTAFFNLFLVIKRRKDGK